MKGTEKQIAFAAALVAEFVGAEERDIAAQQKMVDAYKARMASGDARDYSAKCVARERLIEEKAAQIKFVKSLDDAAVEFVCARRGQLLRCEEQFELRLRRFHAAVVKVPEG